MKNRTQDQAVRAAAEPANMLGSSATSAPDPVPDPQEREREPDPHDSARQHDSARLSDSVRQQDVAPQMDAARQIVLRQLAMVPRSRAQLEQKLAQRDCPPDVAAAVLDRMTEVGLVDDAAYAQMLVRSQQSGRGLAKRALAHELRAKGIGEDLADQALALVSDEDERDRARALVDKKLRAMHGLGIEVQTRRLAGMLARKGYASSLTYTVIREAIAEAPEHLPD